MAEFDSVIPAGGSGTLKAKVRTSSTQNGKLSKGIVVTTDSSDVPTMQLTMSFEVQAPIAILPRPRLILNAIQGETKTEKVLLRRQDGKPLEITEVGGAANAPVDVRYYPAENGDDYGAKPGDVWVEVSVPADAPATRFSNAVVLHTNHPDAPEMKLPFSLMVRPEVEAMPATINLWLPVGQTRIGTSAALRLRHNGGKSFAISGIEVSDPEVFNVTAQTTDSRNTHTLKVELVDGLDPEKVGAALQGSARIKTDDPERPLVEVPVVVAPRSSRTATGLHPRVSPARPPVKPPIEATSVEVHRVEKALSDKDKDGGTEAKPDGEEPEKK